MNVGTQANLEKQTKYSTSLFAAMPRCMDIQVLNEKTACCYKNCSHKIFNVIELLVGPETSSMSVLGEIIVYANTSCSYRFRFFIFTVGKEPPGRFRDKNEKSGIGQPDNR